MRADSVRLFMRLQHNSDRADRTHTWLCLLSVRFWHLVASHDHMRRQRMGTRARGVQREGYCSVFPHGLVLRCHSHPADIHSQTKRATRTNSNHARKRRVGVATRGIRDATCEEEGGEVHVEAREEASKVISLRRSEELKQRCRRS